MEYELSSFWVCNKGYIYCVWTEKDIVKEKFRTIVSIILGHKKYAQSFLHESNIDSYMITKYIRVLAKKICNLNKLDGDA